MKDNSPMLLFQGICKAYKAACFWLICAVDGLDSLLNTHNERLLADDGGGMDPEGIRRCMSLGFSSKRSKSTIGQCKSRLSHI